MSPHAAEGREEVRAMLDAERAGRWAGRLIRPGHAPDHAAAVALVERLHRAADRALPLAEHAGRLAGPLEAAGRREPAPVLVVDRSGWARAAARSMVTMVGSALPAGRSATAQLALALAVLGTRVLGQFDPYTGRLLLVAPTIGEVGRSMGVDEDDFALWVCVHEQTHALQFQAAPWLAGHLSGEATALLESFARPGGDVQLALESVVRALRGGSDLPLSGLLDAEQAERLDRVTATMSLLEGHADVAMDAVPPAAIPSRRRLRAAMAARRTSGGWQQVVRRLMGMEAKHAQYRDGAAFVRQVRRAAPDALDVAWSTPEALPSVAEIADPAAWLSRTRP
ncbi:zinc-dependent metalloprotease [Isoptericola sp. b441]|uniref:Zinc-dependent metalloprotease n=1 Tax=Actinotalea lenta TaxID=3064654 RepID=A0ABT9D6W2_9CELL|nr:MULTISPECIES: zinc-dependent metalloprotease [unclassified Isoptericola]MDO8106582.1 zinc-dependent metalloprotease [Isoptericola sp. b441]MDO8121710.1 zinc-dependent metalloprotease [Isoptericola sp. b490]